MNPPLYLEESRMWLANHVHERRREMLLVSVGLLVAAGLATAAGMFVLGWYGGFGGLLILLVGYWACGGFLAEEPLINAQTIRPRLNDVPRSQARLAWWGPEQTRREMAFILAALTAPIHLPVEVWRTMRRSRRLAELEEEPVSLVLAAITERNGAWTFDELFERFGDETTSTALVAMHDLEPVIWLNEPERVTLTDAARQAIRRLHDQD
ncbi:MAG: hypothetical protein K8I27_07870 [Planctomycetes bacterium]|nr:hypothetical protein [Planctomycetota bacterium]